MKRKKGNATIQELSFDPSKNVETRIEGEKTRADDLRILSEKLNDFKFKSVKELLKVQIDNIKETNKIHEENSKEWKVTEKGRTDSIRQVDQITATNTAASLALAIQTLSTTATTNAENLRTALNNTAVAMDKSTKDLAVNIAIAQAKRDEDYNKRLTGLEQSSYFGQGKEKVADPIMDKLILKMDIVADRLSEGKGSSSGMKNLWGFLVGAIGLLVLLLKAFNVI